MIRLTALLGLALFAAPVCSPIRNRSSSRRATASSSSATPSPQAARAKGYITLIENALAEKHKDLGIEVIGAGISGNKVPDLQGRAGQGRLAKKPTIVVIYIGINDVWHGEKDPANGTPKDEVRGGPEGDDRQDARTAGARVVLCTPSVIGEKPTAPTSSTRSSTSTPTSAARWRRNSSCRCATCARRSSITSRRTTTTRRRPAS